MVLWPGSAAARVPRLGARLSVVIAAALAVAAASIVLPLVSGSYYTSIATEVLIFGIVAMSLDLLLGYTGLMSFGHAAFFGLGGYALIIANVSFGVNGWMGLVLAVAAGAVAAAVIGMFATRVSGIPFLMVTMAFAQLIYSAALRWRDVTGGSDGMGGLDLPSIGPFSLTDSTVMYYVVLMGFAMSFLLLRRLLDASLGHTFVGIRENESRMQALGYQTRRYQWLSFTIGGAFAGFAGGLYGLFNQFISPDALYWSASGDILIMIVLGGVGTLIGPVLGAALFLLLKHFVSAATDYWMVVVGVVFVINVMLFPRGVYGLLTGRPR